MITNFQNLKDKNKNLQTTIYRKPTDRQAYLHAKSYHPKSLKESIPYSQILRVKRICSTIADFKTNCDILLKKFINRGYKASSILEQIDKVNRLNRNDLMQLKHKERTQCLPISLTYNKTLPNIKNIIEKHWNLLKIDPTLERVFSISPIIAFRKNISLKQLIGCNRIINNKRKLNNGCQSKEGKCSPCRANAKTLCCRQVSITTTFKSNQTQKTYKIFHNLNCKSKFVIYLLECRKCAIQYVGKAETEFNIRLNNHRKDSRDPKAIPASKHFSLPYHDFNRDAKFTIIEQIRNNYMSNDSKKELLKQRENFWISKLETLTPKGLNQELN